MAQHTVDDYLSVSLSVSDFEDLELDADPSFRVNGVLLPGRLEFSLPFENIAPLLTPEQCTRVKRMMAKLSRVTENTGY